LREADDSGDRVRTAVFNSGLWDRRRICRRRKAAGVSETHNRI